MLMSSIKTVLKSHPHGHMDEPHAIVKMCST